MKQRKSIKLDIAILGGGFGGVYCAKAIGKAARRNSSVLISEDNYMVFQPMLPEVAGSSISPRHVVNPLRLLCRNVDVMRGHVEAIDWKNRSLVLNAGPFTGNLEICYEHLVLALGAVTDLSRIPGMPEHAFLIKNAGDAMYLRTTILGRMEEANLESRPELKKRLTTFAVVGGGYSGVETAGHILDLFRAIHVYYPNIPSSDLTVYLIHDGDHLLPTMNRRLGEYSARKLEQLGLKLILNQRVKSVTANRVHLNNGESIETNTVISTVGNAPHPLVTQLAKEIGLELHKGNLVTESTGEVKGQTHLWAVGDCAAFPAVTGDFCPGTAQFAIRQGSLVGKNIIRRQQGQALQRFNFKGQGEMASIGHHIAVGEIFGVQFSGFLAWWLWRTVYLLKLPRFDRKLRVMLDWTLDLFFPRDLNHLSPRFTKQVKEIYLEEGEVLFHRGEPAFSFYMVKSGEIELREKGEAIQRISTGGYFGERALLEDGLWHHNAYASKPTNLISVPASIFHQLVRGVGSLGEFFQKSATKYQSQEIVEAIGRKIPSEVGSRPISTLMERHVYTLKPAMTVQDALGITRNHPRSSYPVVDDDNKLLGVATREEFYELLKREQTRPDTSLKELHCVTMPTVPEDTSVNDVMKCCIRTGSNKVLVVDATDHLQGIATVMDLMVAGSRREAKKSDGDGSIEGSKVGSDVTGSKKAQSRIETDSMGEMRVPYDALYGAQTARAAENFPISGLRFPRSFIKALGLIKKNAALTNAELGLLGRPLAKAIQQAAQEVADGQWDDQFIVDIFQTGSGTSTNMNANEVIANRAAQLLGGKPGFKSVHPNDHVNRGQSSNDVIPSAIHLAALEQIERGLIPALAELQMGLTRKAEAFKNVTKIGRTHLQDATPLTLGEEFSGYASEIEHGIVRLKNVQAHLSELALGGTAVGTGINTHPEFARRTIARLAGETKLGLKEAANHFEAQANRDACVEASGALKTVAVSLIKIANDIRQLGSGPRCGLGELRLPPTQPGSSIMPGKVNPVMCEMVIQVGAQVIGNDTVITLGGASGNFELNVMMPVIAHNLLQSVELLTNASRIFSRRCLTGLEADVERCEENVERSLALCTALVPEIGYDRAANIAKKAFESGRTIRDVARKESGLDEATLQRLLDTQGQSNTGMGT